MTNALLDKDLLTQADIENLIAFGIEESITLDYKAGDSLEVTDKKKSEIAKDISAFANSAGGYIVYGVNEINHKPTSISSIDGNVITKEWLEQVIQTRVQRKIDGLIIHPIRIDNDIKKSVYVVKIPESSLAPHMTLDKKFYKRYNFESVQMEEYEIRSLYNRKEKTNLVIDNIITNTKTTNENTENGRITYWELSFQVENIGNAIEKDYKLAIEMDFKNYSITFDAVRSERNFNHSVTKDDKRIVSLFGLSPIFPGEVVTIGQLNFGLLDSQFEETVNKGSFSMKLFYSNGTDEMKIELSKIFKKKSSLPIKKENFDILGKWAMKDSSKYSLDFKNNGIVSWQHKPYVNTDLIYTHSGTTLTVNKVTGLAAFSDNGKTLTITGFSDYMSFATGGSNGPFINGTYIRQ